MQRLLAFAAAFAFTIATASAVCAQNTGDTVFMLRDAPLKVGTEVVHELGRGTTALVGEQQGDWLWLMADRNGWTRRSNVIPLRLAVPYANAALRNNPADAPALNGRATARAITGNLDAAIADYGAAIRAAPDVASYVSNRGTVLGRKGETEQAMADFEAAMRLDPKDAIVYVNRGGLWHLQGDYAKALDDFNEAVKLDPESAPALSARAWLLATCDVDDHRDGEQAKADAEKACELTRWRHFQYLDTLAAAYAEVGDFEKAVKRARQAIELAPEVWKPLLQSHLTRFESDKPFRESVKPAASPDK